MNYDVTRNCIKTGNAAIYCLEKIMSDDGSEVRGLVSVESEYNDPDAESKSLESQKTVTEVVFHLLKSSLGIIPVETKENEVKAVIQNHI